MIVYPIDSFQDHMTSFYHCVPNWLLQRAFDLNLPLYAIDSFQDHMTWFLHCVPNWLLSRWFYPILSLYTQLLLSRPYHLIFILCIQLTLFKSIWSEFSIVYPIDSFEDNVNWLLYCVPKLLISGPFDLILWLCT